MSNLYENGEVVGNVVRISRKENPSILFYEGVTIERLFRPGVWYWNRHLKKYFKDNFKVQFCAGWTKRGGYFGC